ncbi:Crp/Fnr family transcriptional regulator [Piscinibacter koreensis]|uniref:Cyclic nucleotide-binding domain-containing protein n=1 Tax=Piscinibacter koreensis TaxID=2742824 RepID=A0A7Y6TUZ7_9BURK|nr:cyclic nucleotide-binding domain-containing protein [Schlegelella koreensis]NUZ04401.1 cyclic nucleotide-binding domain-containing protein [Schlegelella koreensis]
MDIDDLIAAVESLNADDAFRPEFSVDEWRRFGAYLAPLDLDAGDVLIKQGDVDRTMFLLEHGSMLVSVGSGAPPGRRIAILRAGSLAGEPALFGNHTRVADVEAMAPCRVWALRPHRLDDLMSDEPAIAKELLRAASVVMAVRLVSTYDAETIAA